MPCRKIKRAPKRGNDDDDSLSDDDFEEGDGEGGDDSDEEGPEVCPPGCSQVCVRGAAAEREGKGAAGCRQGLLALCVQLTSAPQLLLLIVLARTSL
jgi:hypothetical protein